MRVWSAVFQFLPIQILRNLYTINLPNADADPHNPIYRLKYARLHGLRTDAQIRRLLFGLLTLAIALALILKTLSILSAGAPTWEQYRKTSAIYLPNETTLLFLVILSVMVIGELMTLLITATQTLYARTSGDQSTDWDLIVLSGLPSRAVVTGEESIARIQAWRFVAFEMAFRAFIITWYSMDGLTIYLGRIGTPYDDSSLLIGLISQIFTFGFWFITEPHWRLITTVRYGLRLSTGSRRATRVISAYLNAVMSIRLIQCIAFLMFAVFTVSATFPYGLVLRLLEGLFGSAQVITVGLFLISIGLIILWSFRWSYQVQSQAVLVEAATRLAAEMEPLVIATVQTDYITVNVTQRIP